MLKRRDFLIGAAALPLVAMPLGGLFGPRERGGDAEAEDAPGAAGPQPFDAGNVRALARTLAQKPYKKPAANLPAPYDALSYDDYRAIRFNPERALWKGENRGFELQLFHRGFLFQDRVDVFIVADGMAQPVGYRPDLFVFERGVKAPTAGQDLGFSGFRLHGPINRPDYFDEIAVFQGASYFRAVAKGQVYGLSARGLAINTADAAGEEFPAFRAFWIERPEPGANSVVVHAVLDSPSAAAAYRITIRPGEETVFDVETAIYPRVDLAKAGLAPLTSMFFFDADDRRGVDDFRPAVHDSDGLLMVTGRGETLWRPVTNPSDLQLSAFADTNPRGFGLLQRNTDFRHYEDLEAAYERRPSAWIEPIGDWGDGTVQLVEIPTDEEIHDNIVAFWRPKAPLKAKSEYTKTYRLHWRSGDQPGGGLARAVQTRAGAAPRRPEGDRIFVVDFVGDSLKDIAPDAPPKADVSTSAGKLHDIVVERLPDANAWRLSAQLETGGASLAELRARLLVGDKPVTETWVFRWTA